MAHQPASNLAEHGVKAELKSLFSRMNGSPDASADMMVMLDSCKFWLHKVIVLRRCPALMRLCAETYLTEPHGDDYDFLGIDTKGFTAAMEYLYTDTYTLPTTDEAYAKINNHYIKPGSLGQQGDVMNHGRMPAMQEQYRKAKRGSLARADNEGYIT